MFKIASRTIRALYYHDLSIKAVDEVNVIKETLKTLIAHCDNCKNKTEKPCHCPELQNLNFEQKRLLAEVATYTLILYIESDYLANIIWKLLEFIPKKIFLKLAEIENKLITEFKFKIQCTNPIRSAFKELQTLESYSECNYNFKEAFAI
jgi:hypothetical protein